MCILMGLCLPSTVGSEDALDEVAGELEALRADVEALSRVVISGECAIRLRRVDVGRVGATGPYGEILQEGQTLLHRLLLGIDVRITEKLSVGGLIRLSNEGELAFEMGPDRLSSEHGGVRIVYRTDRGEGIAGYYEVHFTPLTLMRWDLEDNPEEGGTSGCACPGAGGAITGEGLEVLGPDLRMEGLWGKLVVGEQLEVAGLLARPRIAEEEHSYRQYMYGLRGRFPLYHRPSTSFRHIALSALWSQDDEGSVQRPLRMPYFPVRNILIGADIRWPIGEYVGFKGEYVRSRTDINRLSSRDAEVWGYGCLLGAWVTVGRGGIQASCQRLSPGYVSLYSALSYRPDRHGIRVSGRYAFLDDRFLVWGFYKRLRSVHSSPVQGTFSTLSAGMSAALFKGLGFRLSEMVQAEEDESDIRTYITAVDIEYSIARKSTATFMVQWMDHHNRRMPELDHRDHMVSLLVRTLF